jgi:predicted amidohydrolase
MPEIDPNTSLYYNSAVLIGPEGVIGCHRKTHPYISEPKWAAAGDSGHQVFDTPLGRIGMLVCMDIHFPETARLLAWTALTSFVTSATGWQNAPPRPTGLAGQWKTVVICWRVTAGD